MIVKVTSNEFYENPLVTVTDDDGQEHHYVSLNTYNKDLQAARVEAYQRGVEAGKVLGARNPTLAKYFIHLT